MRTSTVLKKAAKLLRKGPWGQGVAADRPGTLCVMDAVHRAGGDEAYDRVGWFLHGCAGEPAVDFNDAKGRTQAEVVEFVEVAAINAAAVGE